MAHSACNSYYVVQVSRKKGFFDFGFLHHSDLAQKMQVFIVLELK